MYPRPVWQGKWLKKVAEGFCSQSTLRMWGTLSSSLCWKGTQTFPHNFCATIRNRLVLSRAILWTAVSGILCRFDPYNSAISCGRAGNVRDYCQQEESDSFGLLAPFLSFPANNQRIFPTHLRDEIDILLSSAFFAFLDTAKQGHCQARIH